MGDICTSSFSNHHTRGVGPLPGYHKCALSTAYSISSLNRKLNQHLSVVINFILLLEEELSRSRDTAERIVKINCKSKKGGGFFSSLTFPQPRTGYSGHSTCYQVQTLVNPGVELIVSFIPSITFCFFIAVSTLVAKTRACASEISRHRKTKTREPVNDTS